VRAVVTGGAGFIGSHLVDALAARGDEVLALDDLSKGRRARVEAPFSETDIRDAAALAEIVAAHRPHVILHLAAQADVRLSVADPAADAAVNVTLHFPGGVTSQFRCGFDAASANAFEVLGSRAALRFPQGFSSAEVVELDAHRSPPRRIEAPFVLNGFEGEIAEAQACIRAGRVESPRMPHAETLALLSWMDAIRARFPQV